MSTHYCGRCKRVVPNDEWRAIYDLRRPSGSCGECGEETETSGNRPICPVCGFEYSDPWEMFSDEDDHGEIECANCDTPLAVRVAVSYTYYAEAIAPKTGGTE